jgi:hypothetical protein
MYTWLLIGYVEENITRLLGQTVKYTHTLFFKTVVLRKQCIALDKYLCFVENNILNHNDLLIKLACHEHGGTGVHGICSS